MDEEIQKKIKEKGFLLDRETFQIVEGFENKGDALYFLDNLDKEIGQKIITKQVLSNNIGFIKGVIEGLSQEGKEGVERISVKLGISLEVQRERKSLSVREREEERVKKEGEKAGERYKVFYAETIPDKKLEFKDFVGNFRARYQSLQRILMERSELRNNLVGINKIGNDRQSLGIIGIVTEKRITKNKNIIIKFEDMTGEISGVVKNNNEELFSKADELMLDDVVGVKASGNRELLFIQDIIFPDSVKLGKVKFEEDVNVAFLSDVHCGSDKHLGKEFERFLEWINSEDEDARKINYLFIMGDNVDGVGVYPGQEGRLDLKSMREQYKMLANYLKRVPKRITMFMCAGQHDATRVAEPQPVISKRYAQELYDIENLVLVTNPSMIKLIEKDKEFKILMYHGAGVHGFVNSIKELREINAYMTPSKIFKHCLKRRHLAPTHSESIYIPNANKDPLVMDEVPDVFATGDMHRLDVDNYNGVLIICSSCWQSTTDFEEKIGHVPDPSKVPLLNLKSREIKIFDFSEEGKRK
jgi:DNA polymerase II small subunit